MAEMRRVRFEDVTGARTLDATVAPDTPLGGLLEKVAVRIGYGMGATAPVALRIFHREGRAILPAGGTIGAAGVQDGETLVLLPAAPGEPAS